MIDIGSDLQRAYDEGYRKGKEDEHRWWSEHCANCTDNEDEPQTETKTETQKSNLSFKTDTPIFIHGKSVDKSSISSLISDLNKLKTEMTELGKE